MGGGGTEDAATPTGIDLKIDNHKEKTAGEANDSSTKVEEDQPGDSTYDSDKLTCDEHCYECKVRFRDPKPRDLMMFLHAWRYSGPDWSYETQLPPWAQGEWQHQEF